MPRGGARANSGGSREGAGRKRVGPNMAERQLQSRDRRPIKVLPTDDAWVRGQFDKFAVDDGFWFSEVRGMFTVWWIERYCKLYEGEWAGEPMTLRGCAECENEWVTPSRFLWPHERGFEKHWDEHFRERVASHLDCVASGHRLDWQFDDTIRCFGWVKWSEKYKRDVRRFRKASIWKAKKNKKSPTLASWSLYQTGGDGENGQKVFMCARDGNQARDIAGEHALAMIDQSPELSHEFKVNLNKMRFSHWPTRSFMQPLSSNTSTNKKAKEGINGSLMVDETHVVDREFMARVKRAGISRSEPLHCEFSTAGDDPDAYGKDRFDYAMSIHEGVRRDDRTFVSIHAARQDMSEGEIVADPIAVGKQANPALGHTVDEEEYLADFSESRTSVREFAMFKQYRLNIWLASSNPWLSMSDWSKCRRDFNAGDLIGRPSVVGLDLARKSDMTSAAFVFRGEYGDYYQLPYFWLPEERATSWRDKADYQNWSRGEHLSLTDGDVADYSVIEDDIVDLIETFKPDEIVFDPYYGEEITQRISKRTGIDRTEFRQGMQSFAGPTACYERLLGQGKLLHNGHPLLSWQAGHVEVKVDHNKNKRPVKEKVGSHKSIDGIVAGIMALARAYKEPRRSAYEKRGLRVAGA